MSLGLIIGGALQGIGAGVVQQGQQKADTQAAEVRARRDMALAKYQSDLKLSEQQNNADLIDRNDARSTTRKTDSTLITTKAKTASQIAVDNARSANDATLARLQSRLRMNEDQASKALDLANEATMAGIKIKDIQVMADGTVIAIRENGQTYAPKIYNNGQKQNLRVPPKGGSESGESPLTARGIGSGARPAAMKPATAPKPASAPAAEQDDDNVVDPAALPFGDNDPIAAAGRRVASPPKTYTQADLEYTARQQGKSIKEVKAALAAAGYKLVR